MNKSSNVSSDSTFSGNEIDDIAVADAIINYVSDEDKETCKIFLWEIMDNCLFNECANERSANLSSSSSSSTIRLRPLGLFLPPRNHLPISLLVFLYFFFLWVCNLNFFLGSLLSSILCISSLQFILYCVNLSLY